MSFGKTLSVTFKLSGLILLGSTPPSISAQESSSKTALATDTSIAEEAFKARLAETRTLLENGRDDDAESRLAQDSQSSPQTAEWHQEKSADFLRIALSAQESGNTQLAQKAARHALVHLTKAETLSADNTAALSAIFELRGVIRERLLGTTEEAITEYKKALKCRTESTSALQKLRLLDASPEAQVGSTK